MLVAFFLVVFSRFSTLFKRYDQKRILETKKFIKNLMVKESDFKYDAFQVLKTEISLFFEKIDRKINRIRIYVASVWAAYIFYLTKINLDTFKSFTINEYLASTDFKIICMLFITFLFVEGYRLVRDNQYDIINFALNELVYEHDIKVSNDS